MLSSFDHQHFHMHSICNRNVKTNVSLKNVFAYETLRYIRTSFDLLCKVDISDN